MDFNTGSAGSRGARRPAGGMRAPGGVGEFSLSDPVNTFISTVRNVLLSPADFFRGIAKQGDYLGPLVFALICGVIYGIFSGIVSLVVGLAAGDVTLAISGLIGALLGGPFGTVIGVFISAGILHLLVMLLVRPANAGFEATYRVAAYTASLVLLIWLAAIPVLGEILGLVILIYYTVVYILGIRGVHSTTTGRAALIVLIPTALGLLLLFTAAAALLTIFSFAPGPGG